MRHTLGTPRKTLGVLFLAGTLLLAPASMSLADDHDDVGVECFVGDDWAIFVEPGDEVTCEAWGLEADETFEWEVEFVDLETDALIDDDGADDVVADEDGVGVFSFTVPSDISAPAFFEGWVTQDDTYEEPFLGLILLFSDVTCAPDPVDAGDEVACEVHGLAPGEWFYWAADLTDGTDLDFDDIDLDDLLELDLDDFDLDELLEDDLGDPHAEGEGEADGDGVGRFSFEVPEDTDAVEYVAGVFAEGGSLGFYIGSVEPVDTTGEAPVEEEEDDDPVVVQRPTRVDTGAGGTAGAGGVTGTLLAALLLTGLTGATLLRRRLLSR